MNKAPKKKQSLQWITQLPEAKDYKYWSDRFKNRQTEYSETKEVITNNIELSLPEDSLIVFFGDQHIGSPDVNYKRIEAEVGKILETPNTYVILMGDTVDGYFWGGDAQYEEMEQVPEQYEYIRAMTDLLGSNGKLICSIGGDHDGWAKRGGYNPIKDFAERNNCFYSNGVTYITINIGEAKYYITAGHRLPGHSMYNKNHPQTRAMRFGGAVGSDIIVSGHNHQKSYQVTAIDKFGGEGQNVHLLALGAYKSSDGYGRKLGFNKLTPENMFGSAVKLMKDEKQVEFYYDILRALE